MLMLELPGYDDYCQRSKRFSFFFYMVGTRVIILGAGPAGVGAAWQLANRRKQRSRF